MKYEIVSGPHTHGGDSSSLIMYQVVLALVPATLFGIYLFGLSALMVLLTACASALITEWLMLYWRGANRASVMDGSALLTGWLLAMSLPPATPWWVVVLGSAFAIAIGKHAYGGLGNNLFNPAMLARVMLLICFPVELTDWHAVTPIALGEHGIVLNSYWLGVDAMTAATPLSHDASALSPLALMSGQHAGSMGETSSLLILLGGVFLLWRKVINAVIPTALLLGLAVPAFVLHLVSPEHFLSAGTHLFSGAAFLAAFFIATDMVTSPASSKGQWVYGVGCGVLIYLIRTFGNYPEGAAFAVLIMNATTPIIDHYLRPAVFGAKPTFFKEGKA
ncbi:RnfABCDGE type electron transport complex subunit D [Reinekea marinisedimentorum]|uniref:Ion-translocating oxidoreductase complex subunit D n=1 Tax=Reinekea marinisedimentorum TaxID=230495 RepID=A0A4R3I4I1_9GAMM|nr:RnfABCDGE type electron transport complex subunit D [Reinekea marinisedimentorum]TCS38879.1 electron transport complex protein RnfD [Reinekea marinisedimentorum]